MVLKRDLEDVVEANRDLMTLQDELPQSHMKQKNQMNWKYYL